MPFARLQFATSAGLLLLYVVVGLTGSALHYAVENLESSTAATDVASHAASGYFHCHGPDHHWHYHGGGLGHAHHPPAGEDQPAESQESADGEGHRWPACRDASASHSPHACPLLAIVATLKLASGASAGFLLDLAAEDACEWAAMDQALQAVALEHLARGPPPPTAA